VVRLASLEEIYFPTATRVVETADGDIDIYFDRIHLRSFAKGELSTHWPVQKER
jgi:hypothetical protein